MSRLTKEQAVVISAYTGFLICEFSDMQAAVEKKLGRRVWTHEFESEAMSKKIREAFKPDFLALAPSPAQEQGGGR